MSIRFKFRSAFGYDVVDIGGRPSLPAWELRQEIICLKRLKNTCQEFDLVFVDEESGEEYDEERNEVPSGSTVIVKRVPVGTARYPMAPISAVGSFWAMSLCPKYSANDPVVKVDDFCIERYPTPLSITDFNPEDEEDVIAGALRSESPKVQAGGGREVNTAAGARAEEQMKLHNTPAAKERSLPSEFKCFLCKAYLREAVMIPCCQHSFCYKCISQVLIEKGKCPKCLSGKCKVENLLPNLSLRRAVERFREYQILPTASENAFNRYAPDGESRNHAIDASHAVTVIQRKLELPHSPTGTGKGSNVILPESSHTSNFRTSGRGTLAPHFQKGGNTMWQSDNFNEADSTRHGKRELWDDAEGENGSFLAHGRQYMDQGNWTCYMCGSLDHFGHECPYSYGPHPMPHLGYPSYLNRAVHPPFGSFSSMYGMMSFNASLVPLTAYVHPPFVPTMFRARPTVRMMRSGSFFTPEVNRTDSYAELKYAAEKRRRVSPDYFGRDHGIERWSEHHDKRSKRLRSERQQLRSDSSQGRHHQSGKEVHVRPRADMDHQGSLDHRRDSYKKQSTSNDRRRQQKDRDPGLGMRCSRQDMKHKNGHPYDAKGHMVSFPDEEHRDDNHSRKWRRVH